MTETTPTPGQLWAPGRGSVCMKRRIVEISSTGGIYYHRVPGTRGALLSYETSWRWVKWVERNNATVEAHVS